MDNLEKRSWLENIVSTPGPASKRLAERLIRKTVKHEVLDSLDDDVPKEQAPDIPTTGMYAKPVPVEIPQEYNFQSNTIQNYNIQSPVMQSPVMQSPVMQSQIPQSNMVPEAAALMQKVASYNSKYNS